MEAPFVASQHRNQHYTRSKYLFHYPNRFRHSPGRGFREFNCRSFQSGTGILPKPLKSYSTPSTSRKPRSSLLHCEDKENFKSNAISRNAKATNKNKSYNDDPTYSELWAGPAYSNSPPPSSLPMPKFSLRQKRSMSLNLPPFASDIKRHTMGKSAPPSPTRYSLPSSRNFFLSTDFATKNLRRMLHLDISDE